MSAAMRGASVTRLARKTVWVLARLVDYGFAAQLEYFTGEQGENGGPSRSPFRADAFKFSSAKSALECAETHRALRDSEVWRLIPVVDMVPEKRR
jgi:hypothetical protein